MAEKFMGIEYNIYMTKSQKEEEKEILFLYNYNIIKIYFIFVWEFIALFF